MAAEIKPPSRAKRLTVAAGIAAALASSAEGLRQVAYYDPPGILTVCRGHTGSDIDPRKVYSLAECDQYLSADMRKAIVQTDKCAPGLPAPTLAAFGDATFNLGPIIVCDTQHSTAARLLKAGRIADACRQLPRWNKARIGPAMIELPGLTKRRAKEMELCLSGITTAPAISERN